MAKYLDSGAFQAALVRKQCGPANQRYTDGWNDCLLRVKSMVSKAPAADVAPVVHGRWIDGKCSNCGVDIPTDDAHDVIFGHECRFCYYYGAKMDGERKDGGNG